jgi:hypothetical protein
MLYPNPVKYGEDLFIIYENSEISDILIEIYTIDGRKIKEFVFEKQNGKGKLKISTKEIPSGIYFYKIVRKGTTGEKKEQLKKLLILKK